ncbi:hypothetical protein OG209_05445 [Streptomyces sp. NBC_01383]|uniref:hypothetical protein n=1 Tax=Streptomyces sp. NBC_01383 TaxID=2903846 RepID=UPI00324C089B
MNTQAAMVELLRAGHSDKAIARQLHTHRRKVREARLHIGLAPHRPGPAPSTPEDVFWRRTQPTDDGHLLWPGPGRQLRGGDNKVSVYRVAFRIGTGREPEGIVTNGCGRAGCVHPSHVEDQPMRQQYKAIFGGVTA